MDKFDFSKKCEELAVKTDGYSGREISKLIVSCQSAAYSSDDGILTEKMIDERLAQSLASHDKKIKWRSGEEEL